MLAREWIEVENSREKKETEIAREKKLMSNAE
jgi:hypothetical protein